MFSMQMLSRLLYTAIKLGHEDFAVKLLNERTPYQGSLCVKNADYPYPPLVQAVLYARVKVYEKLRTLNLDWDELSIVSVLNYLSERCFLSNFYFTFSLLFLKTFNYFVLSEWRKRLIYSTRGHFQAIKP